MREIQIESAYQHVVQKPALCVVRVKLEKVRVISENASSSAAGEEQVSFVVAQTKACGIGAEDCCRFGARHCVEGRHFDKLLMALSRSIGEDH